MPVPRSCGRVTAYHRSELSMRRSILFTAMLLLFWTPLAVAQVYTWIDSGGVRNFSQSPPPQGITYKVLLINSSAKIGGNTTIPSRNLVPNHRLRQAGKRVTMADTRSNRTKYCDELHKNLRLLESKQALNTLSAKGKSIAIDTKQRAEQLKATQAEIAAYCHFS